MEGMSFYYRLARITAESLAGKVIRDIQGGADRSVRKAVDLGKAFAKGGLQKEFFALMGDVTAARGTPYNRLIKRCALDVDEAILTTIGANLGITSFTFGVHEIRKGFAKTGRAATWLQELDLSGAQPGAARASGGDEGALEEWLESCFKNGAFAFLIHLGPRGEAFALAAGAAARHPECTFILAADPGLIGEAEAARILEVRNTVLLIRVGRHHPAGLEAEEAFRVLRRHRLLYGFLYAGDAPGCGVFCSDKYLEEAAAHGCFLGIYSPDDTALSGAENDMGDFVLSARKKGAHPILLLDAKRDVADIQDLILEKRHFV